MAAWGYSGVCVHVLATTKRLEIYWGDVLWGAVLYAVVLPPFIAPPSTVGVRCLLRFPPSFSTAVKEPTQEMWIILLWLLEICSGAGPGASCPAQMLPSKVNVVLVSSSVSAHWEGRKCRSRGLEQVVVRYLLSQNKMWIIIIYIVADAAGECFTLMCAGLGWWVGALCHSLGRAVPVGPWTSGPAHVYWTKPGCSLGKVRCITHMVGQLRLYLCLFWLLTTAENEIRFYKYH